ncbi:hypothetical protein L1987_22655 [Smallanthus sonchifolius]|uniref:Uncharacterized protein n=1 Tax=Smallanthus sonchifolius TaxID=185202 RepID=A0ACB9IGX7_9ASTR|nr:hypothetical protein L1987_22655 [Smallanthus sonchifolius]
MLRSLSLLLVSFQDSSFLIVCSSVACTVIGNGLSHVKTTSTVAGEFVSFHTLRINFVCRVNVRIQAFRHCSLRRRRLPHLVGVAADVSDGWFSHRSPMDGSLSRSPMDGSLSRSPMDGSLSLAKPHPWEAHGACKWVGLFPLPDPISTAYSLARGRQESDEEIVFSGAE